MNRDGLRDLAGVLRLGPAIVGATLLLRGDGLPGPVAPAVPGPQKAASRQPARPRAPPRPAFGSTPAITALPGAVAPHAGIGRKAAQKRLLASASAAAIGVRGEASRGPALASKPDRTVWLAAAAKAAPLAIAAPAAAPPLLDIAALPAVPVESSNVPFVATDAAPIAPLGDVALADATLACLVLPQPAFGGEVWSSDYGASAVQGPPALTALVLALAAPRTIAAGEPVLDGPAPEVALAERVPAPVEAKPATPPERLAQAGTEAPGAAPRGHFAERLIPARRPAFDDAPGRLEIVEPALAPVALVPPPETPAETAAPAQPATRRVKPAALTLPEPAFGRAAPVPPTATVASKRMPEPVFGKALPRLALVEEAKPVDPLQAKPAAIAPRTLPEPAFGRASPRVTQPGGAAAPDPADAVDYAGNAQTWPAGRGASADAPQFTYDDQLVLEVRVGRGEAADTVIAYGTRQGVYLPLGALARLFDLAINVSDDGHFASGWFISQDRTLTIDLRRHKVFLKGKEMPLNPADAVAFDGEMYLKVERFADYFPLKMKVNLRDQAVDVQTLEPFPFEQRMAREAAREKLEASQQVKQQKHWPRQDAPYRMFSPPLSDLEFRAASDSNLGTRGEADLRMSGDLAFLTAQTFFSASTRDGLVAARIELGRDDPDADLLGPLKATSFQFGDVATGPLPIGLRGTAGRGAYITNQSLEQASVFDKIDLRGALPDGYEVELYRNGILLGSTRTPVNGQYQFLQIPLDFGLNVLRLVFYGPQGQRYEEVRRMNVGDGRLGRGQLVYQLGAVQKDVNLLGVTGPNFYPTEDYGARRLTASISYGLTSKITALLGGAWYQTHAQDRWQVSSGIRSAIGSVALRFDAAAQKGGGSGYQLGLGGSLFGGLGWRAVHSEYRGLFIDENQTYSADFLRRATQVDLDAALHFGDGAQTLPLSARIKRLEFADGHETFDASLRSSMVISRYIASNTFDYSWARASDGSGTSQLLGAFDLATLSGSRTQVRGSLGYTVLPKPMITQVAVGIDHAFDKHTLVHAAVGETFSGGLTQLGLSAARQFDRFTLAFDSNYEIPTGTYAFVLRLGFSFGRNPLTGHMFMDQPGLSAGGATALRAFRDVNADGRYDTGDKLLQGIDFVSGSQAATTGKDGIAFLGHLGAGTKTSVQMDPTTLPDISLEPVTRGVEVVPRPGRVQVVDFPVQALAEVEGTAYFETGKRKRGVSGVRLELVDAAGKVAATGRSEADGYFLFEQVRPGKYTVRIEPDQAKRLNLSLLGDATLEIKPGETSAEHDVIVATH